MWIGVIKVAWRFPIAIAIAILCATAALSAQEPDDKPTRLQCFDPVAIQWVHPGEFETALKKASEQQRILLINGLGFGIDEEGARCATKGCW